MPHLIWSVLGVDFSLSCISEVCSPNCVDIGLFPLGCFAVQTLFPWYSACWNACLARRLVSGANLSFIVLLGNAQVGAPAVPNWLIFAAEFTFWGYVVNCVWLIVQLIVQCY